MTAVQDLLALELARSHRELPYPDRLHVHCRGGGRGEAPPAHELRCFPNTRQASALLSQSSFCMELEAACAHGAAMHVVAAN